MNAGDLLQQVGIAGSGVIATLAAVKVQIRYIEKRLDEAESCIKELPDKYVPRRELAHTLRNLEQSMLDVKEYVRMMARRARRNPTSLESPK